MRKFGGKMMRLEKKKEKRVCAKQRDKDNDRVILVLARVAESEYG